jgi:hypothetical protein
MKHVYLSYANDDEDVMKIVRSALEANAVPVWAREQGSRSRDVAQALENASCFVAIFSPNARDSRQIHSDFETVNLRVFPFLVGGDYRHSVIYGFLNSEIYDARVDFGHGLRQLVASVKDFHTHGIDNTVQGGIPAEFHKEYKLRSPLPPKHDIFISYRHKDDQLMREIREKLHQEGFSTWVDIIDVDPAASWRTEILNGIEQARALLVIITPQTEGSRFIPDDIEYARLCGVPVFTLLAEGDFTHVLPSLRVGTILDYRNENQWRRLIDALHTQIGRATSENTVSDEGNIPPKKSTSQVSPPPDTPETEVVHHDIFLSFSSKDVDTMRRVRDDLRAAGLSVWTMEGIEPGTANWRRDIERAIKKVNCMVVLFSPDSAASKWVNEELSYADLQGKPIIPLLVRGEPKDALPYGYTLAQNIDVRSDEQYTAQLPRLLSSVNRYGGGS